MQDKKTTFIYRIIRWFVWLFSPKFRTVGLEKLPDEACIIVGNHSQMYGPIAAEIFLPGRHEIWCAGQMMHRDEVAAYAFEGFWSFKPRWTHGFFRLLSRLITPLSVCVFNNAHTIPVYHDTRLLTTYRTSVDALQAGRSVVIFPEKNVRRNNILYAFQDKFVDLARFYYKKAGVALSFVPLYVAPARKTLYLGDPIRFDPTAPIAAERERICGRLADAITGIACSLPEHTVVPYRNIRKRDYPKNTPLEVYNDEKTCG